MKETHHLKAESIESASEVSTPEISQTHILQPESIESVTTVSTPTLTVLTEKIQLADRVSNAEKQQMLRWARERFEEISESINDIGQFLEIAQHELENVLSSEAMQVLIEILKSVL